MISLHATSKPKPRKPGQKAEPPTVKKTEKDLDQFRKTNAGSQVFSDDGKELNPYIPHFISAVPWFYKTNEPTLRHQSDPAKSRESLSSIHESYIKGVPVGNAPRKFVPGSCENCGSSSHKRKDCFERPRKVGAKYSNKDLKPADYVQPKLKLDYEGKRDRWAGYDPNDYSNVIREYEVMEQTKQEMKSKKLEEDILRGTSSATSLKTAGFSKKDESDDDEKYADSSNMPGTKYDIKQRGTVRNLRIREDTAKYLYNLDENSAFYDPKSRAMRQNPLEDSIKGQNVNFKGDLKGAFGLEVAAVEQASNFTLNAFEKGIDVHLLTDPTKSELLMRQFNSRKQALDFDHRRDLIKRYGGGEHMFAPPKEILYSQSEEYVEYSRTGKVIKGQERAPVRSKYIEDIYPNNHTSVWGSYFENFKWGYACCHSFLKNSYCIAPVQTEQTSFDVDLPPNKVTEEVAEDVEHSENSSDEEMETPETNIKMKRKYNVIHDTPFPTSEEMEKYQMKRIRSEDPLLNVQDL
ncbi:Pre-mRNA-splicing factor SLU7 [Thelohanellus kitauei]|uniref:Pre-mRNA-splicing factor SLU7 n=1 Tax=Thelohanellus kitauei TaxID=669202 RepID=A0A0C2J3S7_THEKT|nr:Pre-mRNA-splicing factor SLU7 [Thelohanellus kitauei]